MPRLETEKLNKEKALFILLALVSSAALYQFLSSSPATVAAGKSIGNQPFPAPHENIEFQDQSDIDYYVKRPRMTPFTTPKEYHPQSPVETREFPPPFHPPPEDTTPAKLARSFVPREKIQIAFVGVVMRPDEPALALMRSKIDESILCKKEGDGFAVGEEKYKITSIEKQAICLTDKDGTPFILDDGEAQKSPCVKRASVQN
jgi:hypothetical protein